MESDLTQKKCGPCEGGIEPLNKTKIEHFLSKIEGWQYDSTQQVISRGFRFRDYYHTMAFVNAIAWMAHKEGHHPDLEVGYNHCLVRYTTHAIGGLSENDFICAAKIDVLFKG